MFLPSRVSLHLHAGLETEAIVDGKRNRDLTLACDFHWGSKTGGAPSISLGDYYVQGNHVEEKMLFVRG